MIIELILVFFIGYLFGCAKVFRKIKQYDMDVYDKVDADLIAGWNNFCNMFRIKTKEEKVEKLKEEIEELESEA